MFKTRFISMLVLLMTAVTGAWAQTEGLLTSITTDHSETITYSTAGCATLTTSGNVDVSEVGDGIYVWTNSTSTMGSLTVTPSEGYTITKVVFKEFDEDEEEWLDVFTDTEAPYTCYMKSSEVSLSETMDTPETNTHKICKIDVYGYANVPATVAVTGVTLAPTTATLTLGETETVTLIPTVLPGDATDKSVTWSSSNEAVATVSNEGVVTAVAAGEATITVTATNGTADTSDDFSATCEVTVTPATYSVALKSVTEDASNWQGKAGTGDYQELPLTGLEAGTAVSVKYNGTKKVKSVKAKKKQ